MTKYAELYKTLTGEKFSLDGNAVIGRNAEITDRKLFSLWKERLSNPKVHTNKGYTEESIHFLDKFIGSPRFKELKHYYKTKTLEVKIVPKGDTCVSRRQLMFCLPDNKSPAYSVVDLFSICGTRLNDKFLEPGKPTLINDGDILYVPRFENNKLRHTDQYKFTELEQITNFAGLFVIDPAHDTYWMNSPSKELKQLLERRKFKIDVLKSNVTKEDIKKQLENYAKTLRNNDYFLFLYGGHGCEHGELCLDKNEKLGHRELYSLVSNIRAKKIMLFECCYSGYFLENLPKKTAVGVANKEKDISYAAMLMEGLIKTLKQNHHRMDLHELIEGALKNNPQFAWHGIKPGIEEETYTTVCSSCAH